MSRVGKRPVAVPSGINVTLDGTCLVAKKGNLEKRLEMHGRVDVTIDGSEVSFARVGEGKQDAAYWGTYRAFRITSYNVCYTKLLRARSTRKR